MRAEPAARQATEPAPRQILLPLHAVLLPGGVLHAQLLAARYGPLFGEDVTGGATGGVAGTSVGRAAGNAVDRVMLGVVALREAGGARPAAAGAGFEKVGVHARVVVAPGGSNGHLRVRCEGRQRFRLVGTPRQRDDGLWEGAYRDLEADAPTLPAPSSLRAVQALARAIAALRAQGRLELAEPFRLDDAGWVANRWTELLPVPLAARQRLMELADPQQRLRIVDAYLHEQGIVS